MTEAGELSDHDQPAGPSSRAFAHASEAEMARILDFYAVRWEYEPRAFPILWNLDGAVVESFAPDFYLPELDLFLEMTTLRQKLVRKKNRKLRRLRELYPDIRIKLFYARDFRALMLKYGKLALVDALSGTPGQVGPARVSTVGAEELIELDPGIATASTPASPDTAAASVVHVAPLDLDEAPTALPIPASTRPSERSRRRARQAARQADTPARPGPAPRARHDRPEAGR